MLSIRHGSEGQVAPVIGGKRWVIPVVWWVFHIFIFVDILKGELSIALGNQRLSLYKTQKIP